MKVFFLLMVIVANGPLDNIAVAATIEPVCSSKSVTLRKGPGSDFAATWSVPKFMPLLKVDRKGKWLKVQDLEGETHWARSTDVSAKLSCVVVKTKIARLRTGPGHEHPGAELSSVDRYTPFLKLERDGEWLRVKDDFDGVYWVHETNIWIPVVRTKMAF